MFVQMIMIQLLVLAHTENPTIICSYSTVLTNKSLVISPNMPDKWCRAAAQSCSIEQFTILYDECGLVFDVEHDNGQFCWINPRSIRSSLTKCRVLLSNQDHNFNLIFDSIDISGNTSAIYQLQRCHVLSSVSPFTTLKDCVPLHENLNVSLIYELQTFSPYFSLKKRSGQLVTRMPLFTLTSIPNSTIILTANAYLSDIDSQTHLSGVYAFLSIEVIIIEDTVFRFDAESGIKLRSSYNLFEKCEISGPMKAFSRLKRLDTESWSLQALISQKINPRWDRIASQSSIKFCTAGYFDGCQFSPFPSLTMKLVNHVTVDKFNIGNLRAWIHKKINWPFLTLTNFRFSNPIMGFLINRITGGIYTIDHNVNNGTYFLKVIFDAFVFNTFQYNNTVDVELEINDHIYTDQIIEYFEIKDPHFNYLILPNGSFILFPEDDNIDFRLEYLSVGRTTSSEVFDLKIHWGRIYECEFDQNSKCCPRITHSLFKSASNFACTLDPLTACVVKNNFTSNTGEICLVSQTVCHHFCEEELFQVSTKTNSKPKLKFVSNSVNIQVDNAVLFEIIGKLDVLASSFNLTFERTYANDGFCLENNTGFIYVCTKQMSSTSFTVKVIDHETHLSDQALVTIRVNVKNWEDECYLNILKNQFMNVDLNKNYETSRFPILLMDIRKLACYSSVHCPNDLNNIMVYNVSSSSNNLISINKGFLAVHGVLEPIHEIAICFDLFSLNLYRDLRLIEHLTKYRSCLLVRLKAPKAQFALPQCTHKTTEVISMSSLLRRRLNHTFELLMLDMGDFEKDNIHFSINRHAYSNIPFRVDAKTGLVWTTMALVRKFQLPNTITIHVDAETSSGLQSKCIIRYRTCRPRIVHAPLKFYAEPAMESRFRIPVINTCGDNYFKYVFSIINVFRVRGSFNITNKISIEEFTGTLIVKNPNGIYGTVQVTVNVNIKPRISDYPNIKFVDLMSRKLKTKVILEFIDKKPVEVYRRFTQMDLPEKEKPGRILIRFNPTLLMTKPLFSLGG
ncbi:hypothetical protein ACOME3_005549 [Neoechinorhynchus agilis]